MRKRSKYRPKGVLIDTLSHVITGMHRVGSIGAGTTLKIKNHNALDTMRKGLAERDDVDILIGALNIAEALTRMRIGDDWKIELRAAQDALFAVGSRGAETGKFILRGPELISLNLGMEIHDAQLDACTISDLEKAMDIVYSDVRHHKARPLVVKEKV